MEKGEKLALTAVLAQMGIMAGRALRIVLFALAVMMADELSYVQIHPLRRGVNGNHRMIGHHAVPVIVDAYVEFRPAAHEFSLAPTD